MTLSHYENSLRKRSLLTDALIDELHEYKRENGSLSLVLVDGTCTYDLLYCWLGRSKYIQYRWCSLAVDEVFFIESTFKPSAVILVYQIQ